MIIQQVRPNKVQNNNIFKITTLHLCMLRIKVAINIKSIYRYIFLINILIDLAEATERGSEFQSALTLLLNELIVQHID